MENRYENILPDSYTFRGAEDDFMTVTVAEYIDGWLKNNVKHTVKVRTYLTYTDTARLHILPVLGGIPVTELTGAALQQFIADKLTNGNLKTGGALSAASAGLICNVLNLALRAAVGAGIIAANPMTGVKFRKQYGGEAQAFNLSEQRKIEEYITQKSKPEYIGILLSLYTGLRLGELLALEWSDVDFKHGLLTVTKTAHYRKSLCHFDRSEAERRNPNLEKGYAFHTDTPKSATSRRIIPLPKSITDLLKEIWRRSKSKYIIARFDGRRIPTHSYQYAFQAVLRKCGIRPRPFHSLRHTFATRALECGIDIKTVSQIMGHSNAAFTLKRYAHSLTEHQIKMMNRLSALLFTTRKRVPIKTVFVNTE
jgi:integrase